MSYMTATAAQLGELNLFPGAMIEHAEREYEATHRSYHNFGHACGVTMEAVMAMNEIGIPLFEVFAVGVGALYHDLVPDNEAGSANLAVQACERYAELRAGTATFVHEAVLATAHKEPPQRLSYAILCDADMSILGAPQNAYAGYAFAVRQEYVPLKTDDLGWLVGRHDFLAGLLDRPTLYYTFFGEMKSAPARLNIVREMDSLDSPDEPC